MSLATKVSTITYAQRASDGHYWVADGVDTPPRCDTDDADALAARLADPNREVRMLGDRVNSRLIVAIAHAGGRVALASPRFGQRACPVDDVIDRIACVRRVPDVAASIGGFHQVRQIEVASYDVASNLDQKLPVLAQVSRHPMRYTWAFVGHFKHDLLAQVIAEIRDPRWFVDPDHPTRNAALRSYFGLCGPGTCASRARRQLARACWSSPGCLFAREFTSYINKGLDEVKAATKTTQRFLEFISGTWLNALTRASRPGIEQVAWDSRLFFDDTTAAAYASYLRRCGS